jgi:hypothetical protein
VRVHPASFLIPGEEIGPHQLTDPQELLSPSKYGEVICSEPGSAAFEIENRNGPPGCAAAVAEIEIPMAKSVVELQPLGFNCPPLYPRLKSQ